MAMLEDWSSKSDQMRYYRSKKDSSKLTVSSKYTILGFISSGTYGRVYKAQSLEAEDRDRLYAIKKFKPDKEGDVITYTGVSQSAIREIALNREIRHDNVVALKEVMLEEKSIFMVFEYAEHDFLQVIHHHSQTLRSSIPTAVLKSLIYQLLNGLIYLHSAHILHRDLKPANVLITSTGIVKIGDLGLARLSSQPLQALHVGDKVVVTIWYRAPELLLGAKHYNKKIDLWAVGCVMAELASLRPVFKGEEAKMDAKKQIPFQRDQMGKIVDVLGPPTTREWPGMVHMPEYNSMKSIDQSQQNRLKEWCHSRIRSQQGYDLLRLLFIYDPDKRLSAEDAIKHGWFYEDPKPTWNSFQSLNAAQIPPHRRITQDDAPSMVTSQHNTQHARPGSGMSAQTHGLGTGLGTHTQGLGSQGVGTQGYGVQTGYGTYNTQTQGYNAQGQGTGGTRKKARLDR
ncbi:kinase-like protein [Pterulicium gracile]|uniref:Cyclin-dependent kinase 8 n=1 Tax=Pterulicium gracile TaxID=1884261 RepID=A0A5C3Q3S2_9AGAR|nr:kinase-like protein [Pterula gracilis]